MDTRPHIQVVVQNYSSHFTIQALYFEQTINQNNAMKRCSGDKVDCGIVFVCTAKKATHANQAHNTLHIAQMSHKPTNVLGSKATEGCHTFRLNSGCKIPLGRVATLVPCILWGISDA